MARTLYFVDSVEDTLWSNVDNWSLESGVNGGEPIPTSRDDVIFDNNSPLTCIVDVESRCRSINQNVAWNGLFTLTSNLTIGKTYGGFVSNVFCGTWNLGSYIL